MNKQNPEQAGLEWDGAASPMRRPRLKNQRGATVLLVAIVLPVLAGFLALAVDIGYYMLTRNELQNVADAAALAGARQLGVLYKDMTSDEQENYVCDPSTIVAIARDVSLQNVAGDLEAVDLNAADVEMGTWVPSRTPKFMATLERPNAVRVTARRDEIANGPVLTFFARVIGIDTMEVSARATAALTGQATSEEGELELPVGISRKWFEDRTGTPCGDHIKFSPTTDPDACGGWTTFTYGSNTNNLKDILDGDLESEGTTAGETEFKFTGGDLAAAFSNLLSLFQRKGYDVDANDNWIYDYDGNMVRFATVEQGGVPLYELDADGNVVLDKDGNPVQLEYPDGTLRNKHAWETTVIVYSNLDGTADCSNPNQQKKVVGYARIRLTDVVDSPSRLVVGEIVCNYVDNADSRGGGGEGFSLMGSIPGLVE